MADGLSGETCGGGGGSPLPTAGLGVSDAAADATAVGAQMRAAHRSGSSSALAKLLELKSQVEGAENVEICREKWRYLNMEVALAQNRCLKRLVMTDCGMGARGLQVVLGNIKSHTTLQELHASLNRFGNAGAESLGNFLTQSKSACFKMLTVQYCGIGEMGIKSIAHGLKSLTTLEQLNISHNNVGNGAGAVALGEALARIKGLKRLALTDCGIGGRGLKAVLGGLLRDGDSTLEELKVGFNRFGDDGASALAEMLTTASNLKVLNLVECNIGTEGIKMIGRAWGGNWALLDLDIELSNSCTGDHPCACCRCGPNGEDLAMRGEARKARRRDLLTAFAMGIHARLGGGVAGEDETTARRFVFRGMNHDIFRLIGEACD